MDMKRFVFQMTCFVYVESEEDATSLADRLSYHHLRTDEEVSRIAEEGDLRVEKVWSAESGRERKEVKRHG